MKKLLVVLFLLYGLLAQSQTLSEKQMQNVRATGFAIVAAKNPGVKFTIMVIPWDGVNSLEYNAQNQINASWHAQAAVKAKYFDQAFDGHDFTEYSSVVLSQADFDAYKSTGTQWWIVCSTLPSFSSSLSSVNENIGIGTNSPESKLSLYGTIAEGWNSGLEILREGGGKAWFITDGSGLKFRLPNDGDHYYFRDNDNKTSFFIEDGGRIGIGTDTPSRLIEVSSEANTAIRVNSTKSGAWIDGEELGRLEWYGNDVSGAGANIKSYIKTVATGIYGAAFRMELGVNDGYGNPATTSMTLFNGGNVGIGTTINSKNYKLAVEGTIGAREIVVETDTWADFVFAENYQLISLNDLAKFINENNHLPDIPSESEVKEEGISLGEMNAKLLQKIEELTLYVIDLQKQVDELKKK